MTPSAVPAPSSLAPRKYEVARVSELDGLRGIAILLVLGFHFIPATGPLHPLAFVFQVGWTGVDLFFVLSGFLITGILLDTAGYPHFYRNFIVRRTLRIFPLYYACLAIYCVLSYFPDPVRWKEFFHLSGWWYLSYLGNVQVTLQDGWPALYLLTPLWSLQVEEQFYVSFPFLVSRLGRNTLRTILFASVVAALLFRVLLALAVPRSEYASYTLMPCRMDALALGGLIAIAQRQSPHWLKSRWVGWLTALSAISFILICLVWKPSPWSVAMRTIGYTALDLAFAGTLVMLIGWRQPALLALCRLRFLVWTGTISYGLYLLQVPAAIVGRRIAAHWIKFAPNSSTEFLISMAASICAAWISWRLFESRILKLKNRFTTR